MMIIFLIAMLLFSPTVHGHEASETGQSIVLDEKLGTFVPLDIPFFDEIGREVTLREFVNKPTVIAPVYLSCTNTCPLLLVGLADVIEKAQVSPGKDYQVLAISFDQNDTPEIAAQKKPGYLKAANVPISEDAWRFLTGGSESIKRFTEAVGFQFKKEQTGFSHPVTVIFLSPEGKIVRYLDGVTFLPFEFEMAVTEASKGRAVSLARKVLLYCMSYDSQGKRYVFNTLRIAATLIIVTVGSFFIYLFATGRKQKIKDS